MTTTAQHQRARALRGKDEGREILKKMAVWNGACGGIALFIYIMEKLA
jgi:hypothetical protein